MSEHLLDDLNERQRDAVTLPDTPLAILAPAGSGKTRVLTRRIAWQAHEGRLDPRRVLAVTFTRKAAGELSERLRALGVHDTVTAGTFHALALAQLRRRSIDRREAPPVVLERKARLLVPLLGGGRDAALAASEIAGEIEWAKARLLTPERYAEAVTVAGRPTPRPAGEVATLYRRYEAAKAKRGVLDFDDLLWLAADALHDDAEWAASQRWRYRHLFVDEFQDVNPAQFRLLRGWLGPARDICVVGDDDQAIFSFTGADAGYLLAFRRHFEDAATVWLDVNYRSTSAILTAAAAVLPRTNRPKPPPRAAQAGGTPPTVQSYATEKDEANAVAESMRDAASRGMPWRAMAVLYRINAQSAHFEEAFRAAGVPYRVRGASRFLERPEVVFALHELRGIAATSGGNTGLRGHITDLEDAAANWSSERREHVDVLARMATEYVAAEGPPGSVEGFVAYLAAALVDDDTGGDAVDLLTFHRAKGLEWPVVFVTGLEAGLVPISHAKNPAALCEERRLLYVAMTRAASDLHLSWAEQRTVGGRDTARRPSPYLAPITDALAGRAPQPASKTHAVTTLRAARDHAARARAAATVGSDPPDPELLGALVLWRRELARVAKVPAYVIFHDSTLAAVAGTRPAAREALLALPGIGPVKVERYGDAVLDVVRRCAS